MNFSQAIEKAKQGIPVSTNNWDFIGRLTGTNEIKQVPANQIWSPENRRIGALLEGSEGNINVLPYMTKMTRQGIINYIPTNEDMYANWMPSDVAQRCSNIEANDIGDGIDDFIIKTELMSSREHLSSHMPFWMLYDQDMIGYHHRAIFVAGCRSNNLVNSTIFNMLSAMINDRTIDEDTTGFTTDLGFYKDDWNAYCDGQQEEYLHLDLDERDFDIDYRITSVNKPTNLFIDIDSLNQMNLSNGENAVDYVKAQCIELSKKFPLLNWVSFSLKEELGNSINLRETDEAADDESYVLKAD